MDLFLLIGFYKVTNQVNSAFNFLRDPETMEDQELVWRENDITLDQLQSNVLMEHFGANIRGMPENKGDSFYHQRGRQEKGRLSSQIVFLEISKSEIDVIYQVKEAYLTLRHIISCCV